MKSPAVKLSVIIHTKNEEKHIAECIRSCKALAFEVLVVDMKSTDKTVAIAQKLGARILSVTDYGYVEPARKAALKAAQGDWIFILDADERVTPTLAKKICTAITPPHKALIYSIPSKNMFLGTWMKHGMRWPDRHIRLFKKGAVSWPSEIHTQAILKDTPHEFPAYESAAILHYHSLSVKDVAIKTLQQAQSETFYDKQENVTPELIRERIQNEVPWRFFEHKGYEDGVPGYISAKFMEYYRFLEFASYWEKHKDMHFTEEQLKQLAIHPQPSSDTPNQTFIARCKNFIKRFI